MAAQRTEAAQQVADLLRTAKDALGLSVSFLSRLDGTTQHLEVVDSGVPLLFREGARVSQDTSFCQAVLDGRLPAVMGDVREHPEAMALPAARFPRLRSFVSVPVRLSDGTLYGTFCAAGLTTDRGLNGRDKALMEVLAAAAAVIVEPGVLAQQRRDRIEDRLLPLMAAGGPAVVLQPIVDVRTGQRVGAEALSRFPAAWGMAPDAVFAEAHSIGMGDALEVLALQRAAALLDVVTGYVAMNVSPGTLQSAACRRVLAALPADRVLLELSEHDPVEDYEELRSLLAGLRGAGMRLAVDDVGAGFSSLRHIVALAPDVIKLDRSIVHGVSTDPVLTSLIPSLVAFAHGSGTTVVAEGVETASDAEVIAGCGVDLGQGWYYGRPGAAEGLDHVAPPVVAAVPTPRAG